MIERHLRRADPTMGGLRLRRAVQQAFDSYTRYWLESFRLPNLSAARRRAGMQRRGIRARRRRRSRAGNGVILALPHLGGWEWAGRWIAEQGHDHGRRRGDRAARAVRLVHRPALEAGHERRAARCRRPAREVLAALDATTSCACSSDRDIQRSGRRGRVLRRATRRCRRARPPCRCAPGRRSCRPRCTSPIASTATSAWSGRRSTSTRSRSGCAPTSQRITQDARRRTRAPDPPSALAVAPVPAQLAQRSGVRVSGCR